MAKYVFEKCCFCIDLRVGCFIIGYLNLIVSVLVTTMSFLLVAFGAALAGSSDPDERTAGVVALVFGIITLLAVAVLLVFAIVLLVGLHKHKSGHVKAYLIYSLVFLLITFILFIVNLSIGPWDAVTIASRIIGLLFSTYILMVIRSYYYKMLEGSEPPKYTS